MAAAGSFDEVIKVHEASLLSIQLQCFLVPVPDKLVRVGVLLGCDKEVDRIKKQFDYCMAFLPRVGFLGMSTDPGLCWDSRPGLARIWPGLSGSWPDLTGSCPDIAGSIRVLAGYSQLPSEKIFRSPAASLGGGLYVVSRALVKPCKPGAILFLSIKYTPVDQIDMYNDGVGSDSEFKGVPGTYFPLRRDKLCEDYENLASFFLKMIEAASDDRQLALENEDREI
nr:phospholipase D gamma 1 [Tanacetum cinerariifolium]